MLGLAVQCASQRRVECLERADDGVEHEVKRLSVTLAEATRVEPHGLQRTDVSTELVRVGDAQIVVQK